MQSKVLRSTTTSPISTSEPQTLAERHRLADDLLTGAAQIGAYIGWPLRKVYYAKERKHLPIGSVGATLIARRSELDEALSAKATTDLEVV
jgi:hypothetical protein